MAASNQTTAQRQAEAKRRAEAARKRGEATKAKPGQKGGQTSGGSSTRSQTVGGGNQGAVRPRGASAPAPERYGRPQSSGGSTTRSQTVGGGNQGVTRPRGGTTQPRGTATNAPYVSPFAGARQANLDRINSAPQFRSPAIGAPVHARPQAFGAATQASNGTLSAQPSVYAPQAGQAPRPNTPQPSAAPQPQAPANPFQAIGNIQGQAIPEGGAGLQQQPVQAGTQEYGGQQVQGVGADGVDMERRRAFLDADNSLSGLKAVKELLNRRKLSIAVEN
jgi:hypothetical protein